MGKTDEGEPKDSVVGKHPHVHGEDIYTLDW